MIHVSVDAPQNSEALHVLKLAGLCGLVLAAYGSLPWSFTALIAVLTGRAMVGFAPTRMTALYLAAVWLATFSPVVLAGNPDVVRTGVAAAALVHLLRGLSDRATFALSAAFFLSGIAATGSAPHGGTLGELEFALGATWPRDWGDVAIAAGLFLLGSAWGKAPRRALPKEAAQGL